MFSLFKKTAKLGNKMLSGVGHVARVGSKVLGTASKYGHKVVDPIEKGISVVEKIPFVGSAAAPVLAPVKGAVGLVSSALGVIDAGANIAGKVDKGIRATQSAVASGDIHQAANVLRDTAKDTYASGKTLQRTARSVLERARK